MFAGAAAGAVAGVAFKGGVGKIGKGRGNPPVEEGKGGRFGDTTAPAAADTVGKRASDQVGGFVEEGATLGTKIGVGVAQGGDPNEVAAGEIANSAPKLGVGPVGKAGLGRAVDGLADKIPIKGSPRPPAGPVHTPPAAQPTTPDPADVPLPPSPTGSRPSSPAPVDPADVPLPPSPTGSRPSSPAPVNPADVPLPPSPTSSGPTAPPISTSDAQSNGGTGSPSPSSDGFVTAPTSPSESPDAGTGR
ncbi:hypothetical protein E4K10_44615 [Streptomyces sp. T1317-0309]|nr:hypothetical protein E4K10_44615 [Streptomyces sp. T1317-0309]